MIVTVVHDDSDAVKHELRALRENLAHVTPKTTFKSCCVWDFKDSVFEENRGVLVMVSKCCRSFHQPLFESLRRYNESKDKQKCLVSIVFEGENESIDEDITKLVGNENIVIVDDLSDTFTWLPKICAFFYKTTGRNKLLKCVVPKTVVPDSKPAEIRENLMKSLRDLDINTSDEFDAGNVK